MRRFILTGFGAGLCPLAPGTAGSALAAALYLVAFHLWGEGVTAIVAGIGALAFASATVAWGRGFAEPDPSWIVSDEIAGMFLALAAPLGYTVALKVGLGFVVFRIADVVKPVGIKRLEKLPGGWGVVADDLAAGALAGLVLAAASIWLRSGR